MDTHKQRKKRVAVLISLGVCILVVPLIVYALLYNSDTKYNMFKEGRVNIQIAEKVDENEPTPQDTTEKELTWTESGAYRMVQKEITVKSMSDSQYVRLMLIPSWCDSNSNDENVENHTIAGLDKYSDFYAMQYVNECGEKRIDVLNSSEQVIFSYILNSDFDQYWDFWTDKNRSTAVTEINQCYFYYKKLLPLGETTQPLIKSIRIPETVYTAVNGGDESYYLYIDVIADAIEQYGDAKENRDFE